MQRSKGRRNRYIEVNPVLFFISILVMITMVVLVTLYATGAFSIRPGETPLSISRASCNSSGVFVGISDQLSQSVSVYSAVLSSPIGNLTLASNSGYVISPRSSLTFSSNKYTCPSFSTLTGFNVFVDFSSSGSLFYNSTSYWMNVLGSAFRGNVTVPVSGTS